jgi:acyl dehydratase
VTTELVRRQSRAVEDLQVGQEMVSAPVGPITTAHIVRWCAATENWHRIHYDQRFATEHDGLPGIVASGTWRQQVICQLLTDLAGPDGWFWRLDLRQRGMTVTGDTVTTWGRVLATEVVLGYGLVTLAVGLRNQSGADVCHGQAVVVLPTRGGPPVPYPFAETAAALRAARPAPADTGPAAAPELGVVTPEVRAMIGLESPRRTSVDAVTSSEIRRYAQATGETDPIHWDAAHAAGTRFRGVVAPSLFPLTYLREPAGPPDALDAGFARDPDFDGVVGGLMTGLPEIPVPLEGRVNGGNQIEVLRCARLGDHVVMRTRISNITERMGRNGPMVLLEREVTCWNQDGEVLLIARPVSIRR